MTASGDLATVATALAGQYEVERELGRGGMGVVYRARDVRLDRPVAIKVLPPHVAALPDFRARFLREARTAANLTHPHIVPVHRADEVDDVVFFVMALVDGDSLAELIRTRGALAPAEVVPWLCEVARALAYAHGRGVVHRDIKPENILVDGERRCAMVTDFGLARLAEASPLTMTGQVLGTVHYMSPEQVSGEPLDGRSDLYSLGIVAYQALSGRLPFHADNASAVLVAHVTKAPPPLASVSDVSEALAAVVDACLAKDPRARYSTGEELARAFESALTKGRTAPPVLSEDQARALWSRAAELEAASGTHQAPPPAAAPRGVQTPTSPSRAYRLDDVRVAAREAGIADRHLERAAAEMGLEARNTPIPARSSAALPDMTDRSQPSPPLAGAPTDIEYEIRVPGEVPESEFEILVDIIRRSMNDLGIVSTLGRTVSWNSTNPKRQVRVTVMPRGGWTTIRVGERLGKLAGEIYGGVMGGGGGGVGGVVMGLTIEAFRSAPITIAAVATLIGAAYGVARAIFTTNVRRRSRMLRDLLRELGEHASLVAVQGARVEGPGERPRLPR
ncbi:MAG TPA: serine/threonine-protein kinase [Gemmatimonadaceae bacterium]|nr:serine/threonine-protein kinase [Gemmatimonadaceae bacterium]